MELPDGIPEELKRLLDELVNKYNITDEQMDRLLNGDISVLKEIEGLDLSKMVPGMSPTEFKATDTFVVPKVGGCMVKLPSQRPSIFTLLVQAKSSGLELPPGLPYEIISASLLYVVSLCFDLNIETLECKHIVVARGVSVTLEGVENIRRFVKNREELYNMVCKDPRGEDCINKISDWIMS